MIVSNMKITENNFKSYKAYALITGAASGMGRFYAHRLAELGYKLILVDINEDGLKNVQEETRTIVNSFTDWRKTSAKDFNVIIIPQDLSKQDAAEIVYQKTLACEVEVLINNAGIMFCQEVCETSEKMLHLIMMIHMYTPLMLCRKFLPHMKERKNGYVLNVSSLAAWMNWPAIGMYGNTKRFVKDFSRGLRVEMRGTGVSITNVYFGGVDTPLFKLRPSLRKLACKLGIFLSPEKAVDKALKATFKRKKGIMPGLCNKIIKPILVIVPDWVLAWALKKLQPYLMKV